MIERLVCSALVATLAACGDSPSAPPGPPPPPVAASAVDVRDNLFAPAAVSVSGQRLVTWTWRGASGHNVTFEDGQGSSATQSSGTHQRTFGTGGTFRYRCTIHSSDFDSGMVGSVVVQ